MREHEGQHGGSMKGEAWEACGLHYTSVITIYRVASLPRTTPRPFCSRRVIHPNLTCSTFVTTITVPLQPLPTRYTRGGGGGGMRVPIAPRVCRGGVGGNGQGGVEKAVDNQLHFWVETRQGDGRPTLVWTGRAGGTAGMVGSRLIGRLAWIWLCAASALKRLRPPIPVSTLDTLYLLLDALAILDELRHIHGLCAGEEDVGGIGRARGETKGETSW